MESASTRVTIAGWEYRVHPIAALFPRLPPEEFSRLRDDIRVNGVRFPVVVCGDWFCDGRMRLSACEELEVDPPVRELEPRTDIVQWIVSANVHRRHLSTSQRAVLGARMAEADGVTLDDAARFMNVSRMSVARARAVQEVGSEALREALLDGTVSVGDAYKVRDVEPARLDEAVSGVRSGDAGSLLEAVSGESEGGPSSHESGAGAGEREPGLPALPRVGDSSDGPSSGPPVGGGKGGDARGGGQSSAGGRGSGRENPKPGMSGAEWRAGEELRNLAAAALGGDVVDVGASPDADDWRGRVFWCPPGGVLTGSEAAFRQALLSSGLEAAVVLTRCALEDAWAQELLGSPRLSTLAFAAGTGGAARWLGAKGGPGPVMLWGFDVDHEAFAEAAEPFGAVVRVGG